MEETKRAKIIAEFKTEEESQVLSEVLEKIRVSPKASQIKEALKDPSSQRPPDATPTPSTKP
jgi:hypothetical protein